MTFFLLKRTLFSLFIIFTIMGCKSTTTDHDFFPGTFPGDAEATILKDLVKLSNDAIEAEWTLQNSILRLSRVVDKFNNDTVLLDHAILFGVELGDGLLITNFDFKLVDELQIHEIISADSLPTRALRYPGKMVSGTLASEKAGLLAQWTAELREGSNYIRQNIVLSPWKKSLKINKVIFFNGPLQNARYSGSVYGSPIICRNMFFGLEHPIAQSEALMVAKIGDIRVDSHDVSKVLVGEGEYVVSIEHGGGPHDFNIHSLSLLQDEDTVDLCRHPLNGRPGSSLYPLTLLEYKPDGQYRLCTKIEQPENASGTIHLFKKKDDVLNFYVERGDSLSPGEIISEWSVIGVAPENQLRRAFLYYLERERARPYGQFLHYNCWWDITTDDAQSFNSGQTLERMNAWNEKFIEPFGVQLKSFVFDDGWDNLDSIWYFDPVRFPDGFSPQAELCRDYNSGIGVWMSPFGGYGENKRRRIISAVREGLETNDKGMSLAGIRYYNRFLERSLDMLMNYKVNYFKYDGFGGYEPAYLPDMEAGKRLIESLRKHNPDLFINITVGSWPSPFWLRHVDCTWRGSGDLHMAGRGTRTQMAMTYRDGTLYNNIVRRSPFHPLNSIMTVGIAYANHGLAKQYINDSIADFRDMVRSYFGSGSSLQELYISHDRMTPAHWNVLAEAALWAGEHENILKDVHWIGGSPINLEVYGFASWHPGKGIITLRNPDDKPADFTLNLERDLELPQDYNSDYILKSPWREDAGSPEIMVHSKNDYVLRLKPFETKVLEAVKN